MTKFLNPIRFALVRPFIVLSIPCAMHCNLDRFGIVRTGRRCTYTGAWWWASRNAVHYGRYACCLASPKSRGFFLSRTPAFRAKIYTVSGSNVPLINVSLGRTCCMGRSNHTLINASFDSMAMAMELCWEL